MVAETVSHTNTFRKRRGLKKVFSVPVGKLRNKIANPGRNGSSSRSGSRSTSHHKVLLRNNRDLARALSCEKERFRGLVAENVNLKARLHDTRLEVHGLERQLGESRQSLTVYQASVMNHLRDAVRHSVSLTESLKLAMGLCFEEPRALHNLRNTVSGCSVTSSSSQPLRLRVNPMVGGHTIRHPTINLRRVVMNSENRIADGNLVVNENVVDDENRVADGNLDANENGVDSENIVADEHVVADESMETDENIAPIEEQSSENVEDISQSIEETQRRPGGLSTCVEEDEDFVEDTNLNEVDVEEEGDEEDDSIRRKVVSFRNTTLEKEKNRSGLESITRKSSSSSETMIHVSVESSIIDQGSKKNCKTPSHDKELQWLDKLTKRNDILKRTPVVALNDISQFLKNSNSVNVQKVISDIDKSRLKGKVGSGVPEEPANGKENCPKTAPRNKLLGRNSCVSPGKDFHFSNETDELCMEGKTETSSFPDNGKRNSLNSNEAGPTTKLPHFEEDPLEGTSWMHLHLFSETQKRTRKGNKKKLSKETCLKDSKSKKLRSSGSRVMNSPNEKVSNGEVNNQAQDDNEILIKNVLGPGEDYDVSDFDFGIKNGPMAQSTPLNNGKPCKSSRTSNTSDDSMSSRKSSRGSNLNNSPHTSGSSSSGNNLVKEVEKDLVVPIVDTKLDSKAFVTVRIKKLNLPDLSPMNSVNLPDLSPTNSVASNLPEVDNCANVLGDEIVDFLGFGAPLEAEEKLEVMKTIMASECELKPRGAGRSCSVESIRSIWSASVTHESEYSVESHTAEVSGVEQGRPRRRAAPKAFKEVPLNKKLRRP